MPNAEWMHKRPLLRSIAVPNHFVAGQAGQHVTQRLGLAPLVLQRTFQARQQQLREVRLLAVGL